MNSAEAPPCARADGPSDDTAMNSVNTSNDQQSQFEVSWDEDTYNNMLLMMTGVRGLHNAGPG